MTSYPAERSLDGFDPDFSFGCTDHRTMEHMLTLAPFLSLPCHSYEPQSATWLDLYDDARTRI